MDQSDIKAAIVKAAPGFGDIWVNSFNWRQNGNVITARPRYPISDMCFKTVKKVFKKLGGRFTSRLGSAGYFELVLKQGAEQNGLGAASDTKSPCAVWLFSPALHSGSEPVFSRLENQLHNLTLAGEQQERERFCIEKAQQLKKTLEA